MTIAMRDDALDPDVIPRIARIPFGWSRLPGERGGLLQDAAGGSLLSIRCRHRRRGKGGRKRGDRRALSTLLQPPHCNPLLKSYCCNGTVLPIEPLLSCRSCCGCCCYRCRSMMSICSAVYTVLEARWVVEPVHWCAQATGVGVVNARLRRGLEGCG